MFRYINRIGLVFCLLQLISLDGFSQISPDSILTRAEQLESQQQFDQAYELYESAGNGYLANNQYSDFLKARVRMADLTQFTNKVSRGEIATILSPVANLIRSGDLEKYQGEVANYYTAMGQYYRTVTGNYPEAISMFDTALFICDSLGEIAEEQSIKIYVEKSQILANQEQFEEALTAAQKALDLTIKTLGSNSPLIGPRYYNLGFIYYRKGHYDRAEELIKKGIDIIMAQDGPEMQLALGYNNLSAIYVAQMDLKEAVENATRFERIVENYLGPGHEAMGMVHWDLGQLKLNVQQFESATEDLSRAIEIFNARFGPEYQQLPDLYHQLGSAYDGMGNCTEGEHYHLKGLQLKEKLFSTEASKVLESFRYLGQHYLDCGDFENSKIYIDKAFALAENSLDQMSLSYSWLYDLNGDYLFAQDSFESSAYAQHTALYILAERKTPLSLLKNPSIDSLFNTIYAAESAFAKSIALYSNWERTGNPDHLDAATETTLFTDQLFDFLRSSYHSSESRAFLQRKARDHYQNMIKVAHDNYDLTGHEKYLEQAWIAMEKSRSLLLMEALKDNQWKGPGLPDSVYNQYRYLQDDLAFLEAGILEAKENHDTAGIINNQDEYFSTREAFLEMTENIKKNYPNYYNLTTQIQPVMLSDISQQLHKSESLIEFFIGEDYLYKFFVTDSETILTRKILTSTFVEDLDQWIAVFQDADAILREPEQAIEQLNELSSNLYQFLFDDVAGMLETTEDLILVPDLKLGYLSFDALCTSSNNSSPKNYLIYDHNIRYAYSGSHYIRSLDSREPNSDKVICGVYAPSYPPSPDTLAINDLYVSRLFRGENYDLPGAQQEGKNIQQIMGGDVYQGTEATETAFKSTASEYAIIHLALHGIINDEEPLYSKLVFNTNDSVNDGYLNAYEIYQMPFNANLTVLSACNTGLGKIEKGEGIMSLSRAFSYSGCSNLVASLWKADDQATSELMVDFYSNLSKKQSVSTALRDAKIKYLNTQKVVAFRHPYFWSAFVSYGQLDIPEKTFPYRAIIIGFLIIAIVIIAANRIWR